MSSLKIRNDSIGSFGEVLYGQNRAIKVESDGTVEFDKVRGLSADKVGYQPNGAGLTATDVQGAIDEVVSDVVPDAVEVASINAQTTGYTLALSDRGQTVTVDSATPVTVTIPTAATVAFPVGTVVFVLQIGAGVVTIEGDTGVTINGVSAGSVDIADRWQGVSLLKVGADTWVASGALA